MRMREEPLWILLTRVRGAVETDTLLGKCEMGLEGPGHPPGMGPTYLKLCITEQNAHRHIHLNWIYMHEYNNYVK